MSVEYFLKIPMNRQVSNGPRQTSARQDAMFAHRLTAPALTPLCPCHLTEAA
jgi:hypothetical protein